MLTIASYNALAGTGLEGVLGNLPNQPEEGQTKAVASTLLWMAEKVILTADDTVLNGISEHDCWYILSALRSKEYTRAKALVLSVAEKMREKTKGP